MTQQEIAAAEKILGAPFSGDLPDNALKVRRNLLIAGTIAFVLLLTGAKIDPQPTLFGIRFIEFNTEWIPRGLLVLAAYFWLHFLWYSLEAFSEWKIRLTGTKVVYQTAAFMASSDGDYPDEPRQSTLYNWWLDREKVVKGLHAPFRLLETKINGLESSVANIAKNQSEPRLAQLIADLGAAKAEMKSLTAQLKETEKTINSSRLKASLARFDAWFKLMLCTQSLRWIIVDLVFPLAFGAAACGLLTYRVV